LRCGFFSDNHSNIFFDASGLLYDNDITAPRLSDVTLGSNNISLTIVSEYILDTSKESTHSLSVDSVSHSCLYA
jgi:hypothetical protein